jgi:signal transduction histidine kinase
MQNGQAGDTIGSSLGTVQRYAIRVPASDGSGTLGVVQVAAQVGPTLAALDTLLHLLLILGAFMLVVAVVAGLFLANRALQPARLAYDRQRDFIADASHELRTPLTMLRSNVEVVLRGGARLPPDDVALLEDTVAEAKHLTALANSMLDLARLEGKETHLEEDVVDLTYLAQEVARWAQTVAAESNLTVTSASSGQVLVLGDRLLLQQAILILLDNAIKYNRPGGSVAVQVWSDGEGAHLEVRDTGIGIEAVHLSRLGERFYRVDKARSRESGGAGLGLSIVTRIAARHGGTFTIESEPGSGTTARLSLAALRTSTEPTRALESAV